MGNRELGVGTVLSGEGLPLPVRTIQFDWLSVGTGRTQGSSS